MYFLMKKHCKNEIQEVSNSLAKDKAEKIIQSYQTVGNNEVDDLQHKNSLPELIKQDKEKFEEEFNVSHEEEATPFKGKPKERHRRVQSLFKDFKPLTQEEKGEPEAFHPEEEADKERYYGPNYPKEQDINEGVDENLDYMSNDDEDDYDDNLDDDLIERDENGFAVPYTLTKEEFDDMYDDRNDLEKETLYWYEGNGTLVKNDRHITGNPNDEEIMDDEDKILATIGDASERFGENEDDQDTVYVYNDELKMLYEIKRIEDNYEAA